MRVDAPDILPTACVYLHRTSTTVHVGSPHRTRTCNIWPTPTPHDKKLLRVSRSDGPHHSLRAPRAPHRKCTNVGL